MQEIKLPGTVHGTLAPCTELLGKNSDDTPPWSGIQCYKLNSNTGLLFFSPPEVVPSDCPRSNSDGAEKCNAAPECFNGGVLENYMWSQTGGEVDVRIPVPVTVKGKDVLVEIKNTYLKVALKSTKEGTVL